LLSERFPLAMGALQRMPSDRFDDSLVSALSALTECAARLQSEPLKTELKRQTRVLLQQVEGTCKTIVNGLVDALAIPTSPAMAYDQMWALRNIGKQCEISRNWISEKQGLRAVAQAMAQHPTHLKLQEEGAWLSYVLCGTGGFIELLRLSQAMPSNMPGTMAVQQATAKAIRELSEGQRERGQEGSAAWSEADTLVLGLNATIKQHSQPKEDLLCECFKALNELMHDHPSRGRLFMQHNGGEALLQALGNAGAAQVGGNAKWCLAGIWLMTVLVTGNPWASSELRRMGALDCLVKCGQMLPGSGFDTMWTLGQVGGPLTILRLMNCCQDKQGWAVSLRALSRLMWESLEDFQDQLPETLKELLQIIHLVDERLPKELQHALQALGGVLKFYSVTIPPGACGDMDAAVELQLKAVRSSTSPAVAKAAAVCLGHMATPLWRGPLQTALPSIEQLWMKAGESKESCEDLRDLMWAAGCIAGLPVLLQAMRQRFECADLQYASLRAIVDLCDEADRGGVGAGAAATAPLLHDAVTMVTGAMKLHSAVVNVQAAGCQALSFLLTAYKAEEVQRGHISPDVPLEVLEAVLHAMRRFPNRFQIIETVFLALRRFLEPIGRDQESLDAVARTVKHLVEMECVKHVEKVLQDFPRAPDLLENAFFVFAVLAGIAALLKEGATANTVIMKSALVQALCDVCRNFTDLVQQNATEIRGCVGGLLAAELTRGRDGEMSQQVAELQRRCEMLTGLLGR